MILLKTRLSYVNRETDQVEEEIIYGEKALDFLYHTSIGNMFLSCFVSHPFFSMIHSMPKRLWFSKQKIRSFVSEYDVNVLEVSKGIEEYNSLDEFFTRELKPGCRPICEDEGSLLSPADGRVLTYKIDKELLIGIKGSEVSVREIIGDSQQAKCLEGGWAIVIRLAPKDYHRFHFPADGVALESRTIKGKLNSVHPIALSSGVESFLNKRHCTVLKSDMFGDVHLVEVGALTVGTIVQTYETGLVKKGEEKGYFRFGGSTVLVLVEPDRINMDNDILRNTENGIETLVKFGTRIASI